MFADKGHAYAARILAEGRRRASAGDRREGDRPGSRDPVGRDDDQDPLCHLGRWPDGCAGRRCERAAAGSGRPDRRRARLHGRRLPGRARHRRHREHPDQGRQDAIHSSARWRCRAGSWPPKTILADLEGKQAKPFSYLDKGTMAMIGRGAAVAQVKGVELHGKIAFAAWLGVHAALMTGGSNRVDRVQELGAGLLRQGTRTAGARSERDAPDGLGGGRRGRAGRLRGRDHLTHRAGQTIGRGSCPATAGTTSSSSAAEPAAARWRATSRRPASGS